MRRFVGWVGVGLLGAPGAALAGGDRLQAEAAEVLIAACREAPEACEARRSELAEAFLVRAERAARDRGDVECVAVANARLLDPAAVAAWHGPLPARHGTPAEPWVQELVAGASGAARSRPPVVVSARGLLPFAPARGLPTAPVGELAVRLGVAPRVGVEVAAWVDGSPGLATTWVSWEGGEAAVAGRRVTGGVGISAGLWDALRGGGEHVLVAGPVLGWRAPSPELRGEVFETLQLRGPAGAVGVGVQVRDHARVAVAPRWFLAVDGALSIGAAWDAVVPADPEGRTTSDGWAQARTLPRDVVDPLRVELALGMELRPTSAARVGLGVRAVIDQPLAATSPQLRLGPEIVLAWSSRISAPLATARVGRPPRHEG